MKKRVSLNIRIGRFFIIPIIGIIIYTNFQIFLIQKENHDATIIVPIISIMVLIIGYFIFRYLDKAKTILFDNKLLYISDKKGAEIISIDRISSLRMTTIQLNNNYSWKIIFKDNNNLERSVSFFPRLLNINMKEFQEVILSNNKDANVQKFFYGLFQIDKSKN